MTQWDVTFSSGGTLKLEADSLAAATSAALEAATGGETVTTVQMIDLQAIARAEGVEVLKGLGLTEEQALAIAGSPMQAKG